MPYLSKMVLELTFEVMRLDAVSDRISKRNHTLCELIDQSAKDALCGKSAICKGLLTGQCPAWKHEEYAEAKRVECA